MKHAPAAVMLAVMLGGHVLSAAADEVPTYDVRKSCGADVQALPGQGELAACLNDEQNARQLLVTQWSKFGPESRTSCLQMVSDVSGTQSYVELLTCLQDALLAKALPKE